MATQGDVSQVTNNSSSNYCKMPDGTLICWGRAEFPAQAAGTQKVTQVFPISFVSNPSVTISWNDSENVIGFFDYVWAVNTSTTQFIACAKRIGASYSWFATWIAIGRWK